MPDTQQDSIGFAGPDSLGHFGPYGGTFVGETLIAAVEELSRVYEEASKDPEFWAEYDYDLKYYVGRPSPLYLAERLTAAAGGARIYLKREDLNHTGAHKVNNTIGQALLAKRMGKTRIIAELAPASTVLLALQSPRASVLNASSTWALKIFSDRRRMSTA